MTKRSRLITDKQIMFSVFCFLQASPLFQSLLFSYTAQESWLVVLISALGGFLCVLPIVILYSKNRGRELCGIFKNICGKKAGTVLATIYLCYFFIRISATVSRFSGFMSTNMLPRTPIIVISGVLIISCITSASRGSGNLCGMSFLFAAMLLFYVGVSIPLLSESIAFKNFFPIFTLEKTTYVKAAVTVIAEPFANLVIFLELFDENESREELLDGQFKRSKLPQKVILGYLLSVGLVVLAVFRDNAVFGEFSKNITAISFQAARLIRVGEVLSRLELIYAILFVATVFFRVSLTLYCMSKLLANISGRGGSTRFVLPMGLLVWGVSLILFSSNVEMKEWSYVSMPFYIWLFEIILPFTAVLICIVKGYISKKQCGAEGTLQKGINRDGKTLYYGILMFSVVLLIVIFFCFFVFNYQIPGPLAPAKWLAEKAVSFFV